MDGFLGFFWADRPDEVELLRQTWANLWETALTDQESADHIKQRINQLQQLA